ncbi:MAG: cyclic nucleotide-binding domain-containing protein [Candidatus Polarisedimenticolia bacterium]
MATPQPFKDYIVRYRRGERIYSTGDPGTEMYIVQTGSVSVFSEVEGRRIGLATMEKGDFFGEMALIESAPHSSCAEAAADCELIEINSTLFDKMIKGNIEIAVRMLRKLSIRMRDANRRLEEMAALAGRPAPAAAAPTVTIVPPARQSAAPPAGPGPSASGIRPAPPAPAAPRSGARPRNCHAVFLSEAGEELFQLVTTRVAIGRFDPVTGLKPEVDLSELDLNRSVSRHHARLTLDAGVYAVTEEVGALNGTFINGKKLVSGKPEPLNDGDVLNLGMVKLVFRQL